jgi:hypothetical protein
MQRMQRLTGRFLPRTPNEADIESMLRDFKDAETMLTKVCILALRSSLHVQGGMLESLGEHVGLPKHAVDRQQPPELHATPD